MTISIITVLYHTEDHHLSNFYFSISKIREPIQLLMHDNTNYNIGLSKAVNKLIQQATSDIIILANPDTLFDHDIEQMINYVRAFPTIGAVPIFIEHDSSRRFPTMTRILVTFTTIGKWLGKSIKTEYDKVQSNRVEQPGGSFLVLSRYVVNKLLEDGYLYDEHFPVFWNDVDMAMRAKIKNIDFIRFPVKIHHSSGHSFKTVSYERKCILFYSKAGMIGFTEKWDMHSSIIKIIFFVDAIISIMIALLGRRKFGDSILKFRACLQ
ncbi:MAG: glycosyltransferase [Thaumarchaeota archaeon]|nr:MAG: glycosyltransferase [Nitrososphaerota archaeon]